jgi:hypothetical protein
VSWVRKLICLFCLIKYKFTKRLDFYSKSVCINKRRKRLERKDWKEKIEIKKVCLNYKEDTQKIHRIQLKIKAYRLKDEYLNKTLCTYVQVEESN